MKLYNIPTNWAWNYWEPIQQRSIIQLDMDRAVCVWVDVRSICLLYVWLCLSVCAFAGIMSLILSILSSHIHSNKPCWHGRKSLSHTLQIIPCKTAGRAAMTSMTRRVSPLCCLSIWHSVWGPHCIPCLLLSLGMWWGAVIYKKWLGGNSSNMICVGAHKTSPSVTLKEWNGRAVLIRLPLSHCRDRKCV